MLQLNAQVSAEDLQRNIAFIKADSKLESRHKWMAAFRAFLIWVFFWFVVTHFLDAIHVSNATNWLIALSGLLFFCSAIASFVWYKYGGITAWLAKCSGDFTWQLNAEGISVKVKEASTSFAWPQIIALVESTDAWYFYLRRNLAVSIPKSACENPHYFANMAAQYWRKHPDNAGLTLQTSLAAGLKQQSFWSDLSSNLLGGLKLAFFVKTTALSFKVRTSQWLALIALDILLLAFFDYCMSGPKPRFNLYGVSDYSLNYALLLLAAMCICTMLAAKRWLACLMVMLLATTFAMELLYLPLRSSLIIQDGNSGAWLHWFVWGAYIVWLLVVVARAIRMLFNYPLPTIGVLTALYSFFVLAVSGLFTQQQFFIKDYDDDYADYEANKIDVEATYYQQAALLAKTLDGIKPERAGATDLYFVGLAGSSYQDVFKSEVQMAQILFDKSFDTAQRSLLLINHAKTVNTLPLANLPNLSVSLDGLAKKMNIEEDILFLFLSSHGSAPGKKQKDYEISTDFYPLEPNNIEAKKLKLALDASGIKNRVIVVSACHSGGFIDVLKDENSLIMTASRKDRSSFGCSNEEKYTYFGDAYFVQSLTKTAKIGEHNFTQAFESAKKIISKKEQVQQKDSPPSEPQMYEGAAIKAKLINLEVRLKTLN
jgi:Peptidase C13 family/YcxB-like protein